MSEAAYHERRAAQERASADAADHNNARAIHLWLADRHAYRAWSIRERDNTHGIDRAEAATAERGFLLGASDATLPFQS